MNNPVFRLTQIQTDELKELWDRVTNLVDEEKNRRIILKLARNEAVLTHKQLYLIAVNLANFGNNIPDWCHQMLDGQEGSIK
jgi:hypothetical protein